MTASALMDASAQAGEPQALIANGKLIRDARLDRYLAAHKQFAGSSALGVPSGFLRNATAIESDR
jgi:sigma-E factor negative regulatory protein RseA